MKLFFAFKCLNKTRDTLNLIYTVILCTAKRKRKKRMKGGGNEGRKERQRGEGKKKEGNREREREREKTQYKYVSMQSRTQCFFVTSHVYFIPIGKAGLDLSRYKFLSCMIILHIL